MSPIAVDKLTITFLVDNCIEWFTKLPPGFTHEITTHLRGQDPPVDPQTGVPIIDFESYCCGAHGFSALIETEVKGQLPNLTLFDTGPESKSLARNIAAMKIPVDKIERVVLSHWHSDHTGGLLSLLNLRKNHVTSAKGIVVDVHPDRPIARGISPGPNYDKIIGQLAPDPSFELIKEAGGVLETHAEGHAVADGTVWVSGEIPRVTEYEQGILGGMRFFEDRESGSKWVPENHIMDERYAAIDVKGKGLVIFSACSHAGIVNVVKDAVKKLNRSIYMIIGGLHLASTDLLPRIPPTVEFFAKTMKPAPTYVLPMHCTGFQAKVALREALGEGCVPAGVGIKVEVVGVVTDEKFLLPPSLS